MARNRTYETIVDATFDTPLVRLRHVIPEGRARVYLKLEFLNPLASVKDRIGRAMVEAAEAEGRIGRDTHIVEPTSGNTGIALAFVAAARGYRLTLTMPESMSIERRKLLQALGAHLEITPASEGMRAAIARAEEIAAKLPNAWMPRQFDNPANPSVHERTTGPEIWADTQGAVDVVVAGVGTGGTITGVTRSLRKQKPGLQAIAVEPASSAVISGHPAGLHDIQGIGAGFVPSNLDTSLLTNVETVTDDEAFTWARRLAKEEGILAGISSGANVAVAARIAARPEHRDKVIVTFACSSGERYLSTRLVPTTVRSAAPPKIDPRSVS